MPRSADFQQNQAEGGAAKIRVNPTYLSDQLAHPVERLFDTISFGDAFLEASRGPRQGDLQNAGGAKASRQRGQETELGVFVRVRHGRARREARKGAEQVKMMPLDEGVIVLHLTSPKIPSKLFQQRTKV